MKTCLELENIEELRRQAGIDDLDFQQQLRQLRVGDSVRLTAAGTVSSPRTSLLVRITSVRGGQFRGCLVRGQGGAARRQGQKVLKFRAAHIHSVVSKANTEHVDPQVPLPVARPASAASSVSCSRKPSAQGNSSASSRQASVASIRKPVALPGVPLTLEQKRREIEELVERLTRYAEFVCGADGQSGTSKEAREQAVAAFHERLVLLTRQLSQIHDELLLG